MRIYGLPTGQVANIPQAQAAGEQYKMQKDALSEQQRIQNTEWLAGASKYALENYGNESVLNQLIEEGKRRGVLDPNVNEVNLTRKGLMDTYRGAITALGGLQDEKPATNDIAEYQFYRRQAEQAGEQPMPFEEWKQMGGSDYQTAPIANLAKRQELVNKYGEGSAQVETFDRYVRAPKITELGGGKYEMGAAGPQQLTSPETEDEAARRREGAKATGKAKGEEGVKGTPAQQAVDQAFASEYVQFTQGGGADAVKNLAQLDAVRQSLLSGQNLTGRAIGMMPEWMRTQLNQEAQNAKEQVEEVVQRNLRVILGAQFTEKEGERLIRRAYNPALPEQTNARRLTMLIKSMEAALNAKQEAVRYYEENGTLRGFDGQLPTIEDFHKALDAIEQDEPEDQRGEVPPGWEDDWYYLTPEERERVWQMTNSNSSD